jgi:uncharacterized protein DUF397
VIETKNQNTVAALAAAVHWRKASYSQGQNECVEVASAVVAANNWRKASYSEGQNACVEVASVSRAFGVRDTKLGASGPILAFSQENWLTFIAQAKNDYGRNIKR